MLQIFASAFALAVFILVLVFEHHVLLLFAVEVVEVLLFEVAIDLLLNDFEDLIVVKAVEVGGVATAAEVVLLHLVVHVLILILVLHLS